MALPSSRQDFINFYRAQNPSDLDTPDSGILERYASEAQERGVLDQYPELKNWRADSALPQDTDTSRSFGEIAKDTGAAVMSGLASVPQQLFSLGNVVTGGLANETFKDATGVDVSDNLNYAVNWWNDAKSDKLKEVSRQANEYRLVDWDGTMTKDAAEFVNKTAFALTHPAYLGDIVAQSLPSMIPVVGAERWGTAMALGLAERTGMITAIQKAAIAAEGVESALARGVINATVAKEVGGMVTKWAGRASLAAIGVTEAGGASSQTRAQVLETPIEQLSAKSPDFRRLVQEGFTPEEARSKLADAAERIAFAVNLPIALVASKLSGAGAREAEVAGKLFTGNIGEGAHKGILRELVGDFTKEYSEEFIQSGGGQFAQNLGVQQTVDPNQSLTAGVAGAAAEGGIAALGQSAALQTPRLLNTLSPRVAGPETQTSAPATSAADLGSRVDPIQFASDTSLFNAGDLVNVKAEDGSFSRVGLEIVGVAGEQSGQVVYQVKSQDGTVTPVPESQLAVFDATGSGERQIIDANKKANEAQLRDQLVTPDMQSVLRERGGLSEDEVSSFPAETLLARYKEITAEDPKPARPATAAFRGPTGELQTGAIPPQGLQLNFFTAPEVNQATPTTAPTNVQTLADYTNWRSNNLRRDAAERFSARQDDEADFSKGQTLMDMPGVVRVPDVERQSRSMAAAGDVAVDQKNEVFASQVDRLHDLVNARVEQNGPEDNFKTVSQLVEQAGGWDAAPDLSPIIAAYEAAVKHTEDALKIAERSDAQTKQTGERIREKLVKAGFEGDLLESTINRVAASPSIERGKALRDAILERRIESKAEIEKARLAQEELNSWIREGSVPDNTPDDVKQQVAAAAVALRSNLAQSLGPVSYAETFAPIAVDGPESDLWARVTRRWSIAGQTATATRKSVAILENDGSVTVRGVFFTKGTWRLAARERGLTKADAYARIRESLLESDVKASDAAIDRALSENPERQKLVKAPVRNAIQRANETVGYSATDNLVAFGEGGYLSADTGRKVIGFVASGEGKPIYRSFMRLPNVRALSDIIDLLRSPSINPSWTGADLKVEKVGSLDAQIGEGGATFGDVTVDTNAASPADTTETADTEGLAQIEDSTAAPDKRNADTRALEEKLKAEQKAKAAAATGMNVRPIAEIVAAAPEAYTRAIASLRRYLGRREGARDRIEKALESNSVASYSAAIEQLSRFPDAALSNFIGHLNADETLMLGRETLERVLANWTAISSPNETVVSAPEPFVKSDPIPAPKQKFEPSNEVLSAVDKSVRQLIRQDMISVTMDEIDNLSTEELMGPFYAAVKKAVDANTRTYLASLSASETTAMLRDIASDLYNRAKYPEQYADGARRIAPGTNERATSETISNRFHDAVLSALARGTRVDIHKLDADAQDGFFDVEGGSYSKNVIHLVVADLLNPSRSNLVSILHEELHDMIANAPTHIQSALHRAIAGLDVTKLAQYGNSEADVRLQSGVNKAGLTPMEWLEENFVEHRALVALDKTYAKNVFATLMRRVKELYYQSLAWIQQYLPSGVQPGVAEGLIEARFERFAAGDYLSALRGETGVAAFKKTFEETAAELASVSSDPATGRTVFSDAAGETLAEVEYNTRIPREEFIRWVDQSGAGDALAFTARYGLGINANVVGRTINDVNWSTIPSKAQAISAPFAHPGRMEFAVNRLLNRLQVEPEVVAADGRPVNVIYSDNAQGGGALGRARHFVYGKEGAAAVTSGPEFINQRVRLAGATKIGDTLRNPILIAKQDHGPTLFISKYEFENGPRLHIVAVNEVLSRPYVETQYVVTVERLDPQLDGTITQVFNSAQSTSEGSSISPDSAVTEANQSNPNGSPEADLPVAGDENKDDSGGGVNPLFGGSMPDIVRTIRGAAQTEYQAQIALTEARVISRARVHTAAYNQIIWRLSEVYNRIISEKERANTTFEKFLIDMGVPNYSQLKADALSIAARELGRETGVDGNLRVDDLSLAGEKDPAELMLGVLTTKALARIDRRLAEANIEIVHGEAKFNAEAERVTGLYSNIRNRLALRSEARVYVRDQLDMLRRFVKKQADLTGSDAELRLTIESLEGKFDENIYSTYSKLMERVPADDTDLDSVIEQSLQVRQETRFGAEMTPAEFLASVQANLAKYPALEALLDPKRPGKASPMLAVVHRFLRSRELLSDQLRTAAFGADAQQRLATGMKQIIENSNEAALDSIRREAAANMDGLLIRLFRGRQGERVVFAGVLRKYLASIERNRRIGRSVEQAKVSREYITNAAPVLRSLQSSIEQRLSAAIKFELVDNAPVIVPESINDTDDQLVEVGRRQVYRLATENATTNQEVAKWLKAQKRWLDARVSRPELQGKVFNTIKAQSERLMLHLQNEDPGKLRSGLMSGAYESITALLRNSGTRAGSVAASMWERQKALPHMWASRDRENGRKFTDAVQKLSVAAGLNSHISTDLLFYQPMAHVFNTVPETVEIGTDLALQRVRLNPAAKKLLMKPGVEAAFRNLAKVTLANGSGWLGGKLKEVNLKVDDSAIVSLGLEDDSVSLLRRHITRGVEGGTFPRQLSSRILQVVSHLRGRISELHRLAPDANEAATPELSSAELTRQIVGEGSTNPALSQSLAFWTRFSDVTPERIDAVRDVLKKFFDRQAVTDFIRPLVQNFESPSIPGPILTEGQPPIFIDAATATTAWNSANDDIIQFADNLMDMTNPDATADQRNTYRGHVIQYFGRQFAKLSNLVSAQENSRSYSPLGVGHIAMDARIGEGFPAEFLDYMKFNDADQRSASNTISINSAFGHDMRDLLRSYQTIDQEVDAQVQQLNSLRAEASAAGISPTDDKRLRKYLKENGLNGAKVTNPDEWIAQRETATRARHWFNFDKLGQLTSGLLKPESGFTGDVTLGVEVFDTIVAGLLASPKSAMKNISSIVDTITFFRSPGFTSLRALKTGGISTVRNAVASAVSVFGIDILRNAVANRRAVAANVLDPDRNLSLRDYFNEKGFNNSMELTRVGRMQSRIRTMRNILTNYTLRLGDRSNTLSTPGFRASPTGIFSWSQQISNFAVFETVLTEYDRLVRNALNLADKNPGYLVGLRDGQQIKAEDVGYRKLGFLDDRHAFAALQDHARQMGKPLEQLVLEAADLKARGLDIFTADTVGRMFSRAVSEVSLESGPTNNPAPMVGTSTGRVAFRLVRWSWAKQFKVFNLFKTQTGRSDFQTALNGLMVLGLMVLPASILLSIILDKYDEDVVGKKSNVRELGGSLENTLYSIVERMTVTGGFGFAGDFTNGMFNNAGANIGGGNSTGSNNPFSLDNRVVALSLLGNISQLSQKAFSQGFSNLTYPSFYRQLAQTMGAGGAMQYMDIINNASDEPVFDTESKVVARINAGNYLRAAGRSLKLELRAGGGSGTANEVTPYITDMAINAMTGDREEFLKAYRVAIMHARQMGKSDPVEYVKQAFSTRHPLRSIFRTAPSPREYRQLLQAMGSDGASAVQEAIRSYNRFGLGLGIRPFNGSTADRVSTVETRDLDSYRRGLLED